MNIKELRNNSRILIEVDLQPLQGSRFQPTGFPDLGAATYTLNDDTEMLLVESAQSMANRLEAVCWDEARDDLIPELQGIPFVESTLPDGIKTNSLLEAHRVNSPYLVNATGFEKIVEEIGFKENQPFDRQKLAKALFKFDPNSLLHGVFLEKIGGVVRLPRALTGFIEASNIKNVSSGGAKIDRIQPSSKESDKVTSYGKAAAGYGNIPFHREEFTGNIKAYFNVDTALINGFQVSEDAKDFLVVLALYKIRRFLSQGLRLRTACDLEIVGEVKFKRPDGVMLPSEQELGGQIKDLIQKNAKDFASPAKTAVVFNKDKAEASKKGKKGKSDDSTEE